MKLLPEPVGFKLCWETIGDFYIAEFIGMLGLVDCVDGAGTFTRLLFVCN